MQTSILRLFSGFVVLVLSTFGATAFYVRHRAYAIDVAALAITENAAPSIVHLSQAHAELHELLSKTEDLLDHADKGIYLPTNELTALRDDIHQHNQLHNQSPEVEGEHESSDRFNRELLHVDHALAQALAAYGSRELRRARELVESDLHLAVHHAASSSLDTIAINAEHASKRAEEIRELRQKLARSSFALTLSSLLWMLTLVALLVYAIRREALREVNEKVARERADELEMFAGRVAHDILNPVSVLSLLFKLLEKGTSREQLEGIITRGRNTLQRIQQLLDGLLSFACAAARPEPGVQADAAQVLTELEPELRVQAEAAGIDLHVEVLAPCSVACSRGILYSLVTNLASNAIKYMGNGTERRITIRMLDRAPMVRFEVEDTGPGIAAEVQKSIFLPYCRGPDTTQRGFGIGLSTVRRAAEAHGGRVGLRSAQGCGSLFWFELPRAPDPQSGACLQHTAAVPWWQRR